MHAPRNQERLKTCAALMQSRAYKIEDLDILIGAIAIESPELFHTSDSVGKRVFADQPCQGELCDFWVFDFKPRSERGVA